MTFGQLMDIIQVLIPTGLVGYAWQWIRTRENRKALAAKEKNDIYKVMYDNISEGHRLSSLCYLPYARRVAEVRRD